MVGLSVAKLGLKIVALDRASLRGLKGSQGFCVLEEAIEKVYSSGGLTELIELGMSRRNTSATQVEGSRRGVLHVDR